MSDPLQQHGDSDSRFLADVNALLASPFHSETLGAVAKLVVPAHADWFVVQLYDHTGVLRPTLTVHADPSKRALAEEYNRRWPPSASPETRPAQVARTGVAELASDISDDMLAAVARDEEHLETIRALGMRSVIIAPLSANDRRFGALSFVAAESHDRYNDRDLRLAEELGRRIARAIERRTRRDVERFQLLAATLSTAASREQVADVVMAHGVTALGAYAGVISLPVPKTSDLELYCSIGYPPEACMSRGRRWSILASIPIAEAARTGEPIFVPSPQAWGARYLGGRAPTVAASRAWAAIPIHVFGLGRGSLLWTYDQPHEFDDEERRLMIDIANVCAEALNRTT